MKTFYFDNNATTQVAPEVIDAMMPFFRDLWGNPSSMHHFGGQVKRYIDKAREEVAALLGADPSEIVFTSCGTESDNMAIYGAVEAAPEKVRIITSRVEHYAVLSACRHFKKHGYEVVEIGVDGDGQLNLNQLAEELSKGPAVVSIMAANNETGVIFPIEQIGRMVRQAGSVMHTDAVQIAGKIPIKAHDMPVDMLSISGHKLHAPKGIGALYIKKGTRLQTFLLGGHQEEGRRGGTENVPYIAALGRACELARDNLAGEADNMARLRDKLEQGILKSCPKDTLINGGKSQRLPNTSNISFFGIEGEAILYHLSDLGIAASSGSACTSGSLEPSHVIRAMGVPPEHAAGSTRFSLSRYTTEDEIDYVVRHVPEIVERLREISPFV